MFSLVATVLFYFKSAYLFERVAERERDKYLLSAGLLPKWPQQLGCVRPRSGTWNFIWVSHVVARVLALEPCLLLFQSH